MPGMGWSDHDERIREEIELCFTYEKGQNRDECCGASGRKYYRVCIYCPNHARWEARQREREEQEHGSGNENIC